MFRRTLSRFLLVNCAGLRWKSNVAHWICLHGESTTTSVTSPWNTLTCCNHFEGNSLGKLWLTNAFIISCLVHSLHNLVDAARLYSFTTYFLFSQRGTIRNIQNSWNVIDATTLEKHKRKIAFQNKIHLVDQDTSWNTIRWKLSSTPLLQILSRTVSPVCQKLYARTTIKGKEKRK